MNDDEVIAWARANGWSIDPVSLYDEEGVEGWRVTSPDGDEWCEVGAWDEPPTIANGARQAMLDACRG